MRRPEKLGRIEIEPINILPDLAFDLAETNPLPQSLGRTCIPVNLLPELTFDLQDDFAACVGQLKSDDAHDRERAIEELSKYKQRAIPFLIAALKLDGSVAELAARELAAMGEVALPGIVEAFCSSTHWEVRHGTACCLCRLCPDAESAILKLVAKLAGSAGSDRDHVLRYFVVQSLTLAMSGPDSGMRKAAAAALARVNSNDSTH